MRIDIWRSERYVTISVLGNHSLRSWIEEGYTSPGEAFPLRHGVQFIAFAAKSAILQSKPVCKPNCKSNNGPGCFTTAVIDLAEIEEGPFAEEKETFDTAYMARAGYAKHDVKYALAEMVTYCGMARGLVGAIFGCDSQNCGGEECFVLERLLDVAGVEDAHWDYWEEWMVRIAVSGGSAEVKIDRYRVKVEYIH